MDLGRKMNEALPGLAQAEVPKDKVHYPSLYLSNAPKEMQEIPQEGTATIRYKVTSRTVREDEDGKKTIDISIDVESFDPEKKRSVLRSVRVDHHGLANAMASFMLGAPGD